MNIEIKSGVPIPPRKPLGGGGRAKSPVTLTMEALEPGQMFEVEVKSFGSVSPQITRLRKTTGREFTTRKLREGVKKGHIVIGVWRTK